MSRVFAYCRFCTVDQTTDNQRQEIPAAGFKVITQRTITETTSGSVATCERPSFVLLLKNLEEGDVLVVAMLDR